jgi:DNA mismatch repair protein MutL
MTIKILPARLANQIAAGEVVERPASVVKELVENSLDAGATKIDIDLSKGGSKLIRIRDNGSGIDKEELSLALSRHATSKIDSLDDLEAISSLGFRGEALASISSVSRLTLTSRTATQSEAWSAYAEGREMAVKIDPAAHPKGTTVEVADLFFNTPARKKFLRTEKTEFSHIDELLKRIALSRLDVTINLRHNGKSVRQYRAAKHSPQTEKRLQAVCGSAFVRHMVEVQVEHQGLVLRGWITTPEGARQTNDLQYCYVNGRMMKDKLINHAIRQSYERALSPDQYAAFVLYIELDPSQVDVNVHPAKHEVRFHQARLVHDFIYQGLSDALQQTESVDVTPKTASAFHDVSEYTHGDETNQNAGTKHSLSIQSDRAYSGSTKGDYPNQGQPEEHRVSDSGQSNDWRQSESSLTKAASSSSSANHQANHPPSKPQVTKAYQEAYKNLMTPLDSSELEQREQEIHTKPENVTDAATRTQLQHAAPEPSSVSTLTRIEKSVAIVDESYLLVMLTEQAGLLNLSYLEWLRTYSQLGGGTESPAPKSQPLLIPLRVTLEQDIVASIQEIEPQLHQLGFQFKFTPSSVMLMAVPAPLREKNLTDITAQLGEWLTTLEQDCDLRTLTGWLTHQATVLKSSYTLSQAVQLLAEAENLWQEKLPLNDSRLLQLVDFSATIAAFNAK